MGVSATGASGYSLARIRTTAVAIGVLAGAGFYVYGPAVTPVMHAAAIAECNEVTGGSYRSYHLEWLAGTDPHWACWDISEPAAAPHNLGWWVTPKP